jgi:hypothetical protein
MDSDTPVGLKDQTMYMGFLMYGKSQGGYRAGCVSEWVYWRLLDYFPESVRHVKMSEDPLEAMAHAQAFCTALREKKGEWKKEDHSTVKNDDDDDEKRCGGGGDDDDGGVAHRRQGPYV